MEVVQKKDNLKEEGSREVTELDKATGILISLPWLGDSQWAMQAAQQVSGEHQLGEAMPSLGKVEEHRMQPVSSPNLKADHLHP